MLETICTNNPSSLASATCPTIYSTVTPAGCTIDSPCVRLQCLEIKSVTVPCSCTGTLDLPAPTETVTGACACPTGCFTTSQLFYLPCAASPPPSPCPVVTSTYNSPNICSTPPPSCAEPQCEVAEHIVYPCSCSYPARTVTVSPACTCRSSCLTTTLIAYPPCATSPPPTTATTTTEGPGCPAHRPG